MRHILQDIDNEKLKYRKSDKRNARWGDRVDLMMCNISGV